MGIGGLIPFLEKASKKGNINQFSGGTAAIDGYCWLHKGAFSCAERIIMGQPTDAYVNFCMKLVNMLLANRIKPIMVFDGRHLPAKAETEITRRKARDEHRRRGAELLKLGQTAEGRSHLKRSLDVSHEMALEVIKECQKINVDCIVAPYEADAQLAYLNVSGVADVVITEDSDLTLFGCKKIFFKMDANGYGLLVEQDRIHLAMKVQPDWFTLDKFCHMCILSGCDYLNNIPGVGLAKALKFVKSIDGDIQKNLPRLGSYINKKSLNVPKEYCDGFARALITFKHQLVYCPFERKQVRLAPVTTEVTAEQLHHAGDPLDEELAFQLALGNLHPFTFQKLHDFDPDANRVLSKQTNAWHATSRATHPSIWSSDFKITAKSTQVAKKDNTTKWPNTVSKVIVLNTESLKQKISPMKRTYDDMNNDMNEGEILQLYGSPKIQKTNKVEALKIAKDIYSEIIEEEEEEKEDEKKSNLILSSPKRQNNPFLKNISPETSPCLVRGRKRRMLTTIAYQPTIVDDSIVTQSKFFSSSTAIASPPKVIIQETQDHDLPNTQMDEFKENDDKSNVLAKLDDENQVLMRTDSGVDMKEDINDKSNSSDDSIAEIFQANAERECSSVEIPDISDLNRMVAKCDVDSPCKKDEPHRRSGPDDVAEFESSNQYTNSLQSSFFKWSNPKNSIKSNNSYKPPVFLNKNSQSLSKSKMTKRSQPPKKNITHDSQQNLLNKYGFKQKSVVKQ